MPHVVFFISPHGYGHAARATAVIAALTRLLPVSRCTAFTTILVGFSRTRVVEPSALSPSMSTWAWSNTMPSPKNLPATLEALQARIPFPERTIDTLAARVDTLNGDLVVCDIAPIGLAVARRCGLPSVLVEKFTWDWIYRGYQDSCPELGQSASSWARDLPERQPPRPDRAPDRPIARRRPSVGCGWRRRRVGDPGDRTRSSPGSSLALSGATIDGH